MNREEFVKKINDLKISDLGLPIRVLNVLNSMNIKTVKEIVLLDKDSFMSKDNFGKTSLLELEAKLEKHGLFIGIKIEYLDSESIQKNKKEHSENCKVLPDQLLELSIDDFNFSNRVKNALHNLNVFSVRELLCLDFNKLKRSKSLKNTSINEITSKLNERGLYIGMDHNYTLFNVNASKGNITQEEGYSFIKKVMTSSLDELMFNKRILACLSELDIKSVKDLVLINKKELLNKNNIGVSSINEIEKRLECIGLNLSVSNVYYNSAEVEYKKKLDVLIDNMNEINVVNMSQNIKLLETEYDIYLDIEKNNRDLKKFIYFDRILSNYKINNLNKDIEDNYYSMINADVLISELVNNFSNTLDEIESIIFLSRMIGYNNNMTLEDIAKTRGITRERVRQIELKVKRELENHFSNFKPFITKTCLKSHELNLDLFKFLNESKIYFKQRENFYNFLNLINTPKDIVDQFSFESINQIPIRELRESILLRFKMPASEGSLINYLKDDFNLSPIQASLLLTKLNISKINDDEIIIEAPTKYLAVANSSIGFNKGIPWADLAKRSKDVFSKCNNIRDNYMADGAVNNNKYLYLYGHGIYRNVIYYDIADVVENKIIDYVQNIISRMSSEFITISDLHQKIETELSIKINFYDLRYIIVQKAGVFNYETSSGRMLVKKNSNVDLDGIGNKQIILNYLQNNGPSTLFQLKDCLKSKSEKHASYIVSNLINDLKVIKVDRLRYGSISILNENEYVQIKNKIKAIILLSDKIILGDYLKSIVEVDTGNSYTRFLYSSLAKIVCAENSFSWIRHCCSKNPISDDFSLVKFIYEIYERNDNLNKVEFKDIATKKLEVNDNLLLVLYYRYCSLKKRVGIFEYKDDDIMNAS